MATKFFPLFLVFLSADGFLLDKTQSTNGPSGTSNQYVTASEFYAETKARHLEDQQLRRYVDNALAVLTSQLGQRFDNIDQKFIKRDNQSVSSQAYASLEQRYIDLELKYTDLERKYNQLQSVNNEFNLIKSQLLSVQNKTSEISNDVFDLKQLGNIKPLQEIKTLQQEFEAVSAQTHSLTVNERTHSQDLLALYKITIEQKAELSALDTNSSNQLMEELRELEKNHSKQLVRLEQNHNSTTAEIISKMEIKEKQENLTISMLQEQINKNAERVAITAHPSSAGKESITKFTIKFDNVQYSVGITNLTAYKTTGKFTCEHEGLYIISASMMSYSPHAFYYIILNGNYISRAIIDHTNDGEIQDRIGAVTLIRKLNLNDQVWLESDGSYYLYGGTDSTFTIIKIK